MAVGAIIGLACLVFAVGLVGSIFLLTGQPDQATVRIDAATGELVVKPIGMMRVWAMSGGVRVPLSAVTGATVVDQTTGGRPTTKTRNYWRPDGARMPGSYLPGVICAGTYRWPGRKELWMIAKAKQALAIDLTDQKYTKVVIQVADPAATAELIAAPPRP